MKMNVIRLMTMSVALFAGGMMANAQTAIWTGGGADDNWSTADNWSPAVIPNGNSYTATVESASATINVDGDYTVNSFLIVSNDVANGSTVALDGTGTLTINPNFGTSAGQNVGGIQNLAEGAGTVLEFNCGVTIANSGSARTSVLLGGGTNNVVRFGTSSTLTVNSQFLMSDPDGLVELNGTVLGSKNMNLWAGTRSFGVGHDSSGYAASFIFAGNGTAFFNGGTVGQGGTRSLQANGGNCTLVFNAANTINGMRVNILSGGAFNLVVNASQDNLSWLQLGNNPSSIDVGGGTISFADSSAKSWGSGTILIKNFTANSVRFGTTSNALSQVQLEKISAEGIDAGAGIDADGYLTFDAPPPVITGETIVDFNLGAYTNVRPADVESDSGYTWDFSDTTPLYDSGTGQNNTIYGGLITTWSTSEATNFTPDVALKNGAMWIRMQNPDIAPLTFTATSAKGMYIWNKDDFLLGSGGTISAVEGNQLLVQLQYQWGGTTTRLVVKQGGIYYVSETSQGGGGTLVFDPSDPTINWAPINTTDYTVGSYAPVTFTDIKAVGIFFNVAVNAQMFLTYPDFQARLNVEYAPLTEISDVSGTLVGGDMILSWQGTNRASYAVQMKTDLVHDLVWSNVVTNMAGTDDIMSVTNATDAPQAFFRTILEN